MNAKLYDQILTWWGSNACLNQWLKPHSLCYRHQPNLQWLWRFHCIISQRLKWIFCRFYCWIEKMGNVLMSCYFSVLILATCKKCRLVLSSGAPSSPCEKDVPPPIAKEKWDVCTSSASSPSITKEDVPFKVQQAKAKVLSVIDTHWWNWLGHILLSSESETGFGIETGFKWLLLGTVSELHACTDSSCGLGGRLAW